MDTFGLMTSNVVAKSNSLCLVDPVTGEYITAIMRRMLELSVTHKVC